MIEAGSISLIGGLVGYGIGMVIAVYVSPFLTKLNLSIKWSPIIMLVLISTALVIGLLSSVYPAVKASKLEPAEALRFI